jgi:hypothetical protein
MNNILLDSFLSNKNAYRGGRQLGSKNIPAPEKARIQKEKERKIRERARKQALKIMGKRKYGDVYVKANKTDKEIIKASRPN